MTFPPGKWSPLLVGGEWPDEQDLAALSQGKTNRGTLRTRFSSFADALRSAQTGPLADQRGHTVDDLRYAFVEGESHARKIAEKNAVKERAYDSAYDSTLSLRHDLNGGRRGK